MRADAYKIIPAWMHRSVDEAAPLLYAALDALVEKCGSHESREFETDICKEMRDALNALRLARGQDGYVVGKWPGDES